MGNHEIIRKTGASENGAHLIRTGLDAVLTEKAYSPDALIKFFEKRYKADFSADAGVWEGYTLKRHTTMVLSQFDKYFSREPLPAQVDTNFFRVILTLHDIGKPDAIQKEGKHAQHKYTAVKLSSVLDELGYDNDKKNLALSLVNGDCIGEMIKTEEITENAKRILHASETANLSPEDFFELLTIYYRSDAGSYTVDAGGFKSLDFLFKIDHAKKRLEFAPPINEKIQKLKNAVTKLHSS